MKINRSKIAAVLGALLAVGSLVMPTAVSAATPKGDAWATTTTPEDGGWLGVTFANGQFVAVGSTGTNRVMTSPDGKTWTVRTAAEMNTWNAVTYGNGTYVAVAGDGTNRVMTSPDGITWTARTAASASRWQSVAFANGLFVAVAQNGTYQIMTSPDGITWTGRTAPNFSVSTFFRSVTYGNGVWVITTTCFAASDCVLTSPDGITWTKRTAVSEGSWAGVTYGNGLFVAVSNDSPAKNIVMTSPDGVTWTSRSIVSGENPWAIIYTGTQFVAAGGNGQRVIVSTDGINWKLPVDQTKIQLQSVSVQSIAYGNGIYIGVGFATKDVMIAPTTIPKRYVGVVPKRYGPGPDKIVGLVFRFQGSIAALKKQVNIKVVVAPASKRICRFNASNNLVALKNGDCDLKVSIKYLKGPLKGKTWTVDAPMQAVFSKK